MRCLLPLLDSILRCTGTNVWYAVVFWQSKLDQAVRSIVEDICSPDSTRQLRGTTKVSKLLRAPQRELEWESDHVIDAVVKVIFVEADELC